MNKYERGTAPSDAQYNMLCDIALPPPFWTKPIGRRVIPVDIITNDTLKFQVTGDTLVIRDQEIPIFNALMRQESKWTKSSQGLLLADPRQLSGITILNNVMFGNEVNGLKRQDVVVQRKPPLLETIGHKLKLVEELPESVPQDRELQWRLHQKLDLRDQREDGSNYPVEVVNSIQDAKRNLRESGYTLVSDEAFGIGSELIDLQRQIFNSAAMVRVKGDHPKDRERARDVLNAMYLEGVSEVKGSGKIFPHYAVYLEEALSIAVVSKAETQIKKRPKYSRVETLKYDPQAQYMAGLLAAIPEEDRQRFASVGVNFFRTFGTVTEGGHSDHAPEEHAFIAIRVNNRVGHGARTQLRRKENSSQTLWEVWPRPDLSAELLPGGVTLIFKDFLFGHFATELLKTAEGKAVREAQITTVTWPSSA